jgi:hypothetical protein
MQNVDMFAWASSGSPPPMLIEYGILDHSRGYKIGHSCFFNSKKFLVNIDMHPLKILVHCRLWICKFSNSR